MKQFHKTRGSYSGEIVGIRLGAAKIPNKQAHAVATITRFQSTKKAPKLHQSFFVLNRDFRIFGLCMMAMCIIHILEFTVGLSASSEKFTKCRARCECTSRLFRSLACAQQLHIFIYHFSCFDSIIRASHMKNSSFDAHSARSTC